MKSKDVENRKNFQTFLICAFCWEKEVSHLINEWTSSNIKSDPNYGCYNVKIYNRLVRVINNSSVYLMQIKQ